MKTVLTFALGFAFPIFEFGMIATFATIATRYHLNMGAWISGVAVSLAMCILVGVVAA